MRLTRSGAVAAAAGLPMAAVILSAAYVVHAGVEAGVSLAVIVRPLAIGVIGSGAVTALAVLLARSSVAGNLAAAGGVIAVIAGGAIGTLLTRTHPLQAALWLALVGIALVLVARIARRQWRRARPDNARVNAFALLVLGIVLAGAAISRTEPVTVPPSSLSADAPGERRDLVLVLLDGYPRADVLLEYFGFDNGPFLLALGQRGFEVADAARSNYAWTELTLLSMLHMTPAHEIDGFTDRGRGGRSQPWLGDLTNRNPVFEIVREVGYRTHTIATNIDHVTLRSADVVLRPPGLSDFELHLIRSTALAGAISVVDPAFFARSHREQVLWSLDTLEREASKASGGRLLIAHVLSPHMPAVLEPDGSLRVVAFDHDFYDDFRALGSVGLDAWTAAFVGQLQFINARVLTVLDTIIAGNPEADVVLFSDHGSGSQYRPDRPEQHADERYSTLFAARTPGIPTPFARQQTPINIFPRWLGARFGLEVADRSNDAFDGYLELVPLTSP